MIKKSYKIGNVLSISVRAKESVFKNIDKYFPNIREIEENNIDYLIIYSEVDNILESYKNIIDSKLIKPFRNLTYNVSTFDSILIAYASKQEFSDDTLIIKEKNKIIILSKDDKNNKNLIRTLCELLLRKLLEYKYFPLHASCVVKDGKAILFMGKKGSGKSTALYKYVGDNLACPLANDITYVGNINGVWKAFGTTYDLTFDSSLLTMVETDEKIRYTPLDFCNKFNCNWIYEAPVESINIVELNKEEKFKKILLPQMDIENYLIKYGKDKNFFFGDIFDINNLMPTYFYEQLSKDIIFNKLSGNIMNVDLKKIKELK